ncbi:MAG TPA: long-chain fatty acid--CoA ligase [Nocardioidaceae bacterium]|nr:long-chain fatty acid--CoA ligase [Nocardioidaceae bacterium]
MREYVTPPGVELPTSGSLTDDLIAHASERPESVLFARRTDDGWTDVTAAEFHTQVRDVAKGLLASGIEAGDRVAIMSRTRYEWTLLDYAIWYAGAVSVPVYETSTPEQTAWILEDSGARAIVVETSEHLSRIKEVRAELDDLHSVWSIDDNAIGVLTSLGADVPDAQLDARRAAVAPEDLATLIYTSGTTGKPKGCMLTHGNFMAEVATAIPELHELFESPGASTLMFLPLGHVFARILQVAAVRAGVRLGHTHDVAHLPSDLETFRPTFVLAVPRVFEKVFNTASLTAAIDGKGRTFDRAANVAIAYSRAVDTGRRSPALRAQHALFDRLVYGRLRESLGGQCTYAVSGGAPLGERLGHFYRGIGIDILEGYGLTETTGALTVNLPGSAKIGSVGRPLPGCSVRVAEDGELLVRGPQVMRGYWSNVAASAQVLHDGWLTTGDVGEIDDEGYVTITGRKKEILVTAGGKNVAPSTLEARIRAHRLVDQCLVVGDGLPYIAALVTIDRATFMVWVGRHNKQGDVPDLVDDPDLRAEIQQAIDSANLAVSQAESVRRFAILPDRWTEDGGQLTPSLKLRRTVVLRETRSAVEALYAR